MAIRRNHHVLAVHDVRRVAAFFTDALGFRVVGEPPGWVFVARDGCTLMLGECRDAIAPADLGDHASFAYLVADDIEALHRAWKGRAPDAVGALAEKPWGMRDFTVRTPEGHRFTVGEPVPPDAAPPATPEGFARSWLAAFNARDLDGIMAHYANDVEHSSPTVKRLLGEPSGIVRGKRDLRAYFEKALAAAPPDLHYRLLSLHEGVGGVTLVYHRTGGKVVAETFHLDARGLVWRAFVAHADPA